MSKISSNLATIKKIFTKYKLIVPNYQRGYSWETNHRSDLLTDIEGLLKPGKTGIVHYTGTLVISENKDRGVFEIVDGQQRLTTIFILLSRLYKKMKSDDLLFKIKSSLERDRILILNKETDDFFKKRVINNRSRTTQKNKSQHNINCAVIEFDDWLLKYSEKLALIYEAISKRLGFMVYSPMLRDELGLMFEVINNRGKQLSQLEKIKNYLIYYSVKTGFPELEDNVITYWSEILENMSVAGKTRNEDEDAFVRYCWLVSNDKSKLNYDIYGEIKATFPIDKDDEIQREKLIRLINVLCEFSYYYRDLFTSQDAEFENIKFQPIGRAHV